MQESNQERMQVKPQTEVKHPPEWERDLNPDHMAGQNIGAEPDREVGFASAHDLRDLLLEGVRLRRMLIDPATGHLVDLTPGSWLVEADAASSAPSAPRHGQPYWLGVIVDSDTWSAWRDGTLTGPLADAIAAAPQAVRDLLSAARTDAALDACAGAETPSAHEGEFVALRDRLDPDRVFANAYLRRVLGD